MLRCALFFSFFCQAEDGIRDLVRSRGLGDVYKRQAIGLEACVLDQAGVRIDLDLQLHHVAAGRCAHHALSLIHI